MMTDRQRDMATLVTLKRHLRDNWAWADEWREAVVASNGSPCLYHYAMNTWRDLEGGFRFELNPTLAMQIYVSGMMLSPWSTRRLWASSIARRIHVMRHGRWPRALSVVAVSVRLAAKRIARFRI